MTNYKNKSKRGNSTRSRKNNKSRKHRGGASFMMKVSQKVFDGLVKSMIELSTVVRLHHWNTMSYSTHKATDSLYESLDENLDKYVEVMIGKSNGEYRIDMNNYRKLKINGVNNNSALEKQVKSFISQLVSFHSKLDSTTFSDVNNIKDDIIADLNKFLYLLTLK